MADYISRETAIEWFSAFAHMGEESIPTETVLGDLKGSIPAADVEPVRHGRWMNIWGSYTCSECDYMWEDIGYKTDFCPGCGAKMDLEGEE